jgi:hypothetical protein
MTADHSYTETEGPDGLLGAFIDRDDDDFAARADSDHGADSADSAAGYDADEEWLASCIPDDADDADDPPGEPARVAGSNSVRVDDPDALRADFVAAHGSAYDSTSDAWESERLSWSDLRCDNDDSVAAFLSDPDSPAARVPRGGVDAAVTEAVGAAPNGPLVPTRAAERSRSLAGIAAVCAALAVIAFGGYDLVQQRATMRAEIRELQARLATTVSREDAEAARQLQRQAERDFASLSQGLETLSAQNAALSEQLLRLESALGGQPAAQR